MKEEYVFFDSWATLESEEERKIREIKLLENRFVSAGIKPPSDGIKELYEKNGFDDAEDLIFNLLRLSTQKAIFSKEELQPFRTPKQQLDHERQLKKSAWKERIKNFKNT